MARSSTTAQARRLLLVVVVRRELPEQRVEQVLLFGRSGRGLLQPLLLALCPCGAFGQPELDFFRGITIRKNKGQRNAGLV